MIDKDSACRKFYILYSRPTVARNERNFILYDLEPVIYLFVMTLQQAKAYAFHFEKGQLKPNKLDSIH